MKKLFVVVTVALVFGSCSTLQQALYTEPGPSNNSESLAKEDSYTTSQIDKISNQFLEYLSTSTESLFGGKLEKPITNENLLTWASRYEELAQKMADQAAINKDDSKLQYQYYAAVKQIGNFLTDVDRQLELLTFAPDKREYVRACNEKYPTRKDFLSKNISTITETNNLGSAIFDSGLKLEQARFASYVKSNFGISDIAIYALYEALAIRGRVQNGLLYQLAGPAYQVIQSIDNGVLISFTDPYYNTSYFFLETKESYPDNFRFLSQSILAVGSGFYEYDSMTGRRKVYKLVNVPLTETYYFLFQPRTR